MEKLDTSSQIAIIGMSGRFPKADNVNQLWQNLLNNIDSLENLEVNELLELGIPRNVLDSDDYVAAARVLSDIELFDYEFFGFSQREAELMDPQIRLLLQCAFNTFEDARIIPSQHEGAIGAYVGIGTNRYLLDHILPNQDILRSVGVQMVQMVNDRDFAATQLAYRLNLTGPAVSVSTACSTSLVAVHNAVQALLAYECDMALAGGASVSPVQRVGYQYQPGSIASPDGKCRPFDHNAQGTCYGSGVATVLLKRYEDAIADGDRIYATILASAINNDGSDKIGFTAPSVKGQSRVISDAIELAEIEASDISYIETHGTATKLGDPIEFEALNQAFNGAKNNSCGIGSIKSNLGHLDTAAGITGLIKASLSIYHGQIPATLNYQKPNPEIDLKNSPFYVVDSLQDWTSPRIAGVSSFGMGGTNAHVILAEPTIESEIKDSQTKPPSWQLLPFSANDEDALEQLYSSYKHFFKDNFVSLENLSWSMFNTRKPMSVRSFIVSDSLSSAGNLLASSPSSYQVNNDLKSIAFMFPGQGSQQLAMAASLSKHFPAYKLALDMALMELREEKLVRAYLFEENTLSDTLLLQPALFCHQYALAKLWQSLDVNPTHLIGHSLGEYVAACIAEVFSLSDAVQLVEIRAQLMSKMSAGAMLAIRASHSELNNYINSEVELAAINGPKSCVLAGPTESITTLQETLEQQGLSCQRLQTSHAFHSAAVEPLLHSFKNAISIFKFQPPKIPVISNVTGTWLTTEQATDPEYWCQQIRNPVMFNSGIKTLIDENLDCFIEVGPGQALSHFTLAAGGHSDAVISGISGKDMACPDMLNAVGHFWKIGGRVNTDNLYSQTVKPVDLPLYPFKKQRVWLSPPKTKNQSHTIDTFQKPKTYQTIWQNRRIIESNDKIQGNNWIFLADDQLFADLLAQNLCPDAKHIRIIPFHQFNVNNKQLTADSVRAVWDESIAPLFKQEKPCQIINCWPLDHSDPTDSKERLFEVVGYLGKILSSDLYQVPITFTTITDRAFNVSGVGHHNPIQSLAHSMPLVMQQEINGLTGQIIDIDLTTPTTMIQALNAEFSNKERIPVRAIRNHQCWQPRFVELIENHSEQDSSWIKCNGHYLITGGLGQLGITLSHWLADRSISTLTLVTRSPVPEPSQWQNMVNNNSIDESLKTKLKQLIEVKKKVKQLTVLDHAWTSEEKVRSCIDIAEQAGGPITGIFHSAAHFDQDTLQPLKHFNARNADRQFKPKVEATYALSKVQKEKNFDFIVLMSSLSAIFAGPGHGIYSAANRYLDSMAKQHTSSKTQWLSVAWDGWNISAESGAGWITAHDAPKLFNSLFQNHGNSNLAVACQELEPRFEKWVRKVQHHKDLPADNQRSEVGNNDISSVLAKCWQDIIGVEKCSPDANFFALGGDSLAAVRLAGLLQNRLNISVTAAELFANSNFQDMTKLLSTQNQTNTDSLLVPLREGKGIPMVLVHPGGGGIAVYQSLIEKLDTDNPIYGIRARGVDAGSDPRLYDDMNHLAVEYSRELADKFQGSSIILVGYCFGGLIANELAFELEKRNVSVNKTILLDSSHPRTRTYVEASFASHLNELFGDLPEVNKEILNALDEEGMTKHIALQAKKSGKFPAEISNQQAENYIRLAENHLTLELNYQPEPNASLVLLRAEDITINIEHSETLGWSGVPVINIPGDHKTMVNAPHVDKLAQQIIALTISVDQ